MGKAERCLRKHTRRTWLSACDHFGHTIWQHWHYGCSLCGISDRLYTLKVKVKNKWIYRTQKSLGAAANWAPRFKRHLWKQLVQRCVNGCCLFHLAAAGSGDSWTIWSAWGHRDSCYSLLHKDIHHSLYDNPDGSKPLTKVFILKIEYQSRTQSSLAWLGHGGSVSKVLMPSVTSQREDFRILVKWSKSREWHETQFSLIWKVVETKNKTWFKCW